MRRALNASVVPATKEEALQGIGADTTRVAYRTSWPADALAEIDRIRSGSFGRNVATAFLDRVGGLLSPPVGVVAVSYVGAVHAALKGYTPQLLEQLAATLVAERGRDLPAVKTVGDMARALQAERTQAARVVAVEADLGGVPWRGVLDAIGREIGADTVRNWLAGAEPAVDDGTLTLRVATAFNAAHIRREFGDRIRAAVCAAVPGITAVTVVHGASAGRAA